jgi:hypothetical protein
MRIRSTGAAIAAVMVSTALTMSAQAPQTPPTPQTPTTSSAQTQPRTGNTDQTITISGCLKEEKDVPGLKPNVAERAGVTNDFVLTNVKIAGGSTVQGFSVASKYEVEGIAEAEMKKHLNHQVELTGKVKQAPAGAAATDAPDFEATSMKMIAATCPAAQ